VKERFRWD